jgi:hypothetical protein
MGNAKPTSKTREELILCAHTAAALAIVRSHKLTDASDGK